MKVDMFALCCTCAQLLFCGGFFPFNKICNIYGPPEAIEQHLFIKFRIWALFKQIIDRCMCCVISKDIKYYALVA